MVQVSLKSSRGSKCKLFLVYLPFWAVAGILLYLGLSSRDSQDVSNQSPLLRATSKAVESSSSGDVCPYMKLSDLTEAERYPKAGPKRHIVDPPVDGKVILVCCTTTKGQWSILVHENWAQRGATRFLDMVKAKYFSNQVPLMRCLHGMLCQFGLAGSASREFGKSLPDDPQWLPAGKTNRENSLGVRRFAKGYFAYAGAGPNTRSNQFIVALNDNKPLGGGSPWEVPWGELVGEHSFETLDKIHTGYGEKGPAQGRLHKEGHLEWVKAEFPDLDWVTSCSIVDEGQKA